MPKATPSLPLQGLFGLIKPSGPTSMTLLDQIKPLLNESRLFVDDKTRQKFIDARKSGKKAKGGFRRSKGNDAVKIGQGGTLDPLADGVLVIGINKGTKMLHNFLLCTKEYHTTALLGCETDSYDSMGSVVRTMPFAHVTRQSVESVLDRFRGEITQLPPIYSALKMEGKPLYEYAREGKPLPRPIPARKCTVHSLELVDWKEPATSSASPDLSSSSGVQGHTYTFPSKHLTSEEVTALSNLETLVVNAGAEVDGQAVSTESVQPLPQSASSGSEKDEEVTAGPTFSLKMVVSSGTYVRSLVHDIAHAVGSAAHVVTLTRTRQGDFAVGPSYLEHRSSSLGGPVDGVHDEGDAKPAVDLDLEEGRYGNCVSWEVFERAIEKRDKEVKESQTSEAQGSGSKEDELAEWEKLVLEKWKESASASASAKVEAASEPAKTDEADVVVA